MPSLFTAQQRPRLPLYMKWASNAPFHPLPVWPEEVVGDGWTRQKFMAYQVNPEAPGKENTKPKTFYRYTNEALHPGMEFWACHGLSGTTIGAGVALIALTAGMVYYATKIKR